MREGITTMLTLDGSHGEGGGQILRSAIALSLLTGQPVRIVNIRAGRSRPGLMRQHLTALQAAQAVSNARVEGAEIGSCEVTFQPGTVMPGDYRFSVGTAGSTTLVLQTILPALALASGRSTVTLEGGTHNPHSPPFEFLARTFLPIFNRLGPRVEARLERQGFYPAGGGRICVAIEPVARFNRLELLERGEVRATTATALVAALPDAIAERELGVLAARLGWAAECFRQEPVRLGQGPGNVVATEIVCDHVTERFTGFGQKGVMAEEVAERVADETVAYLAGAVPVGPHLADQLIVPMAIAGAGVFRTLEPTPHTRSQIEVVKCFLGTTVQTRDLGEGVWEIGIGG